MLYRENEKGWMTEELFIDYIKRIILNLKIELNTKIFFIFDSARQH